MLRKEEKIRKLINEGDYWSVLGLKPGTASDMITFRISDMMEEYPSLGMELNRIQVTLTQNLPNYEQACSMRDQLFRKLVKKYGENCLQLIPRQIIWQQIWDAATTTKKVAQLTEVLKRIIKELGCIVAGLPFVSITFKEWRKGEARRISRGQHCEKCNDTSEITCPVCFGKGMIKEESYPRQFYQDLLKKYPKLYQDILKEDNLFPELVERMREEKTETVHKCYTCGGEGKVSCNCTKDAILSIPKKIKPGWVISITIKKKDGSTQKKSFARAKYSWGQWAVENVLNLVIWSIQGQILLFLVSLCIIISIKIENRLILQGVSFLPLFKAGFQGIDYDINILSSILKAPLLYSPQLINPLIADGFMDGLFSLHGVQFFLLSIVLFFGKAIRNRGKVYVHSRIHALFLYTGYYLTSRWIFGILSLASITLGFFSTLLALDQGTSFVWLGLTGAFSIIMGILILIYAINPKLVL